jgi:uncharacterized protein (DUF2252 family)
MSAEQIHRKGAMGHYSPMALETLKSFQRQRLSPKERMALGKSIRQQTPRTNLGHYVVQARRLNAVSIINRQAESRIPELIPIRHARMAANPFAFYRGSAAIMAGDLAPLPSPEIQVQLCGDMHVSNFGFFSTAERRLVFGINDFDETLPGNFDWDLKRLAASAMVAAESLGQDLVYGENLVRRMCSKYREYMQKYAKTPYVELARTYIDEHTILERAHMRGVSDAARSYVKKQISKARVNTNQGVLGKLTEQHGSGTRLTDTPPFLMHLEKTMYGNPLVDVLDEGLRSYARSLISDRRAILEKYRLVDYARKVVGVGSVGLGCWILYMEGLDQSDPLFLQNKRAQRSVLAPHFPDSQFKTQGQRVVYGQRLIQGAPDLFLGYGVTHGADFYIRQLRDMKGGISIGTGKGEIGVAEFPDYASLFGWALANAHARSGDPAIIAGYCGKGEQLDDAMVAFAKAYAEQNNADYDTFITAIKSGTLKCAQSGY